MCASVRVCLLVTATSCAKTTEPIDMPLGVWTRVGTRNHVLGGGSGPPRKGAILGSIFVKPIVNYGEYPA